MNKKIRKVLAFTSIGCLAICLLILILSLFLHLLNTDKFGMTFIYILVTSAILSAGSFFCINALSFMNKNRIIAYVSLALIFISAIGGLVAIYTSSENVGYNRTIIIIAILTVFFIILVGDILKFGKRYLVLQIITYVITIFISLVIVLAIMGVDILKDTFLLIFIAACIADAGLLLSTSIISNKLKDASDDSNEYIKIKKSDYEALLARIKELENK